MSYKKCQSSIVESKISIKKRNDKLKMSNMTFRLSMSTNENEKMINVIFSKNDHNFFLQLYRYPPNTPHVDFL